MLEDFTIFSEREHDPASKRQFLTLIFENVWLDHDRVIAVQPKPTFLPFFQRARRAQPAKTAGVKYGSDGGRVRSLHIEESRSDDVRTGWQDFRPIP